MKHVKCLSTFRSFGGADCPVDAVSAWMPLKSGVSSKSFARSSGVLALVYRVSCRVREPTKWTYICTDR